MENYEFDSSRTEQDRQSGNTDGKFANEAEYNSRADKTGRSQKEEASQKHAKKKVIPGVHAENVGGSSEGEDNPNFND